MKNRHRANWTTWREFFLSCIGGMVGLGNIWRFPYICFRNGGGAFLVPFLLFMMIIAIPLVFLEFSYSQYSNLGPGKVWICCPLFKGIGYGVIALIFIAYGYYNVIVSWTLYYLGNSFFPIIPWSTCDNSWNTKACYVRGSHLNMTTHVISKTTTTPLSSNESIQGMNLLGTNISFRTSTEEFWERHVLDITDGIQDQGHLRWQLVLCLFASWTLLFFSVIKGIKSSGKVMYVASIAPYIFLSILLIRGLFLDGSFAGLRYFLVPRWKDLLKFSVWCDAAVQVFYSTGVGIGGLTTLASFNDFHSNCYRDAIILPLLDTFTSVFAGCVVFSTLGYMAKRANLQIDEVIQQGPGITFMVYPEALVTLPLPQIWSVLFFLTLFAVGLNTMIVSVQIITTGIFDNFPVIKKSGKTLTRFIVCLLGFLLGLMCVTQGGVYTLQLIDHYVASVSLMFLSLLEVTVLAWIYGTERLYEDIKMMIGFRPNLIWKICWRYICPGTVLFLWIVSIVQHKPIKYGQTSYPTWAFGIGWVIAVFPISWVLIGIFHALISEKGGLLTRVRQALKPRSTWRPAMETEKDELQSEEINLNADI